MAKGEKRTRTWATIIYPRQSEDEKTTCPDNWADVLGELGVKVCVSPLHDKDIEANGEKKKPHRHVIFSFEGVKSQAQVKEITDKIGGVGQLPVNSLYGQVRYLTHKDNPEKAQYSTLDVLTFGGFEYNRYASTKEDEEKKTVKSITAIMNICVEREIFDYCEIADYLISEEPELFTIFRKNPYFFATYLKSKRETSAKIKNILQKKTCQEV